MASFLYEYYTSNICTEEKVYLYSYFCVFEVNNCIGGETMAANLLESRLVVILGFFHISSECRMVARGNDISWYSSIVENIKY